jgi:hypothetical protein
LQSKSNQRDMPLLIPLLLAVALLSYIFSDSEKSEARARKKRGYNSWKEEAWADVRRRSRGEEAPVEESKLAGFVARLATKRHLTDEDKHS